MPSFWVEPGDVAAGRLTLRDAEAHHLTKVRRVRRGEQIRAVDGTGTSYLATVIELGPRQVDCRVDGCFPEWGESPVRLCLAAALVQGPRFDLVIEKATEIGVDSIRPVRTDRGQAGRHGDGRVDRWQRLVRAAVKQCDRSRAPALYPPAPLDQVLSALAAEARRLLVATPQAPARPLRQLLAASAGAGLALLVGPEGGLTPEEIAMAQRAGAGAFSWGTRVLRAETACLALAALVLYEAEQAG